MKKLLFPIVAVMMMTAAVLSSCSEDEDTFAYYTLGISEFSSSPAEPAVTDYGFALLRAYEEALGMSEDENTLIFKNGNFKSHSAELKAKFDNAILPDAPTTSASYSITIVLHGTDKTGMDVEFEDMEIVATRTFSSDDH